MAWSVCVVKCSVAPPVFHSQPYRTSALLHGPRGEMHVFEFVHRVVRGGIAWCLASQSH